MTDPEKKSRETNIADRLRQSNPNILFIIRTTKNTDIIVVEANLHQRKQWTCKSCTFINKSDFISCSMCKEELGSSTWYTANYFDKERPLEAFWLKRRGQQLFKEHLSTIDQLTYGITVRSITANIKNMTDGNTPHYYQLKVAALPNHPLFLNLDHTGKPVVILELKGTNCTMVQILISSKPRKFGPPLVSCFIYARNLRTGEEVVTEVSSNMFATLKSLTKGRHIMKKTP